MSIFSGKMHCYDFISIDQFEAENILSKLFFLSHCHQDHMKGLQSDNFKKLVKENTDIKVYMSRMSSRILLLDENYKFLNEHLVGLEVGKIYVSFSCFIVLELLKLFFWTCKTCFSVYTKVIFINTSMKKKIVFFFINKLTLPLLIN